MTHDRILIATDGSDPARAAANEAITLADECEATLYSLYVLDGVEPPPWLDDPELEPGIDTKAGRALQSVESVAEDRGFGTEIVESVVRGDTATAIIEFAKEHDIDLVVMGTHGRTGLDRLLIGSVSERVVRESPIPVVTVSAD
ncbi:MAG: universal stress protein [Haloquadratum sp.]